MTNTVKTDRVERLRELLEGSSPGPWEALEGKYGWQIHSARYWVANLKCEACPAHEDANAALIVEAINALPDLLAAVEALELFAKLKPEFAEDDGGIGIILAFRDEEGATFNVPLSMIRKARAALTTLKGEG